MGLSVAVFSIKAVTIITVIGQVILRWVVLRVPQVNYKKLINS